MYCFFCKEKIESEDESECGNRACAYLNKNLKKFGLLQFYLITYSSFEKYTELVENMKTSG